MKNACSELVFRRSELPISREFVLSQNFIKTALEGITGYSDMISDIANSPQTVGNIRILFNAHDDNGAVFVTGEFQGWMSIPCTRCLGIARLSLDGAFDAMLLKRTNAKRHIKPKVDSEQDLEVNFDDLDIGFYEGKTVDIATIVRDHVVLSIPYILVCSDECQGLCQSCGINQNTETCLCVTMTDI